MLYSIVNDVNLKEYDTGEVVYVANSLSQAKTVCRNLNLGGGFDGFTPAFFLKSARQLPKK